MDTAYSFDSKRRIAGALPPLAIAVLGIALAATGAVGGWSSWKLWVVLALVAVLLLRAASYLLWGRNQVVIDARGVTRSGKTVPYHSAELELRTVERGGALRIRELVLWEPKASGETRQGVGFDESLERFEQAVKAITARVPEMRIRVSTPSETNVTDERREKVLAPIRPSPAERALLELGKSALSVPPHLRN